MEQEILNLIKDIDLYKKEHFENINLSPTNNTNILNGEERLKVGFIGDSYEQTEDEKQEDRDFYNIAYPTNK